MPEISLEAERLNKGLSLDAAAEQMEVQKNVLRNAELGATRPRPKTAFKIASFYGYKVTDIWPVEEDEKAAA